MPPQAKQPHMYLKLGYKALTTVKISAMFTGLIQAVGHIDSVTSSQGDSTIYINAEHLGLSDVAEGDSIAVNGVCLTAININATHFSANVSKETLSVSTGLTQAGAVNLEKALSLQDKLGGHLVSGHVNGVGEVTHDGVSLTVNTIEKDVFTVNIIPHTIEKTTLGLLKIGRQVNLEIDQIARYIERMQQWETES